MRFEARRTVAHFCFCCSILVKFGSRIMQEEGKQEIERTYLCPHRLHCPVLMSLIPDDFCMYWSRTKFSLLSFHLSKILDPDMAIVHMSDFGIHFARQPGRECTHAIISSLFWEEESRHTYVSLLYAMFLVTLGRKYGALRQRPECLKQLVRESHVRRLKGLQTGNVAAMWMWYWILFGSRWQKLSIR